MMFRLFQKQKEVHINSKYYLFLQDRWARKMNSLTSDLSRRKKLFFLFVFVIITGSLSIYNIYKGFLPKDSRPLKMEVISKPARLHHSSLFIENYYKTNFKK